MTDWQSGLAWLAIVLLFIIGERLSKLIESVDRLRSDVRNALLVPGTGGSLLASLAAEIEVLSANVHDIRRHHVEDFPPDPS